MKKSAIAAAILLSACSAQPEADVPLLAAATPLDACSGLAGRDFGDGVAIKAARRVAEAAPGTVGQGPFRNTVTVPAHCLVEGMIGERMGFRNRRALNAGWKALAEAAKTRAEATWDGTPGEKVLPPAPKPKPKKKLQMATMSLRSGMRPPK